MIIVPAQMTIGIALASVLQSTFEKKGPPLATERGLFEKDANSELTIEVMGQAFIFPVNSKINMKAVQNIAIRKDEDKKDEGEVEKDKN